MEKYENWGTSEKTELYALNNIFVKTITVFRI